jgi:hypothetical protein
MPTPAPFGFSLELFGSLELTAFLFFSSRPTAFAGAGR